MDGDELSQLKAAATDYDGMLALFEKQRSVVEKQDAELAIREEAATKAVDNVKATKARVDELRNKVHRAKIDQARRLAAAPVEVTSSYKLDAASSYREHVDRLVSLSTKLTAMQNHYTYFESVAKAAPDSSIAAKNVKRIDIDGVSAAEDEYPEFSVKLESLLEILADDEKRFAEEGADITAVAALKAQAAEVTALHDGISGPMIREVSRRRYYDDSVEELRASQQRIILWCHQQRSSMEGLRDPEHIQEFINSFQGNIAVMETNFLVLMELAEPLLPNETVQKLMMDATEVWLGLEVYAFERLNSTVVQQHVDSGMEADAGAWVDNSDRIREFLEGAHRLLEMPTDDESKTLTEPVLATCTGILEDFDAHNIIVQHLSDFSVREKCLKDYYDAIRRTIFSKMTLSTQVYNGQYNFDRKQEYMDRLAELSDWVQCKSQSGAWRSLLERVDKMKMLIEENEALHGTSEERGSY
jgi:hypothetical protein